MPRATTQIFRDFGPLIKELNPLKQGNQLYSSEKTPNTQQDLPKLEKYGSLEFWL